MHRGAGEGVIKGERIGHEIWCTGTCADYRFPFGRKVVGKGAGLALIGDCQLTVADFLQVIGMGDASVREQGQFFQPEEPRGSCVGIVRIGYGDDSGGRIPECPRAGYGTNAVSGRINQTVLVDLELDGIRAQMAGIIVIVPLFCNFQRRLANPGVGDVRLLSVVLPLYRHLILSRRMGNRTGDGGFRTVRSRLQLGNRIFGSDRTIGTNLILQDQVAQFTLARARLTSSINLVFNG